MYMYMYMWSDLLFDTAEFEIDGLEDPLVVRRVNGCLEPSWTVEQSDTCRFTREPGQPSQNSDE